MPENSPKKYSPALREKQLFGDSQYGFRAGRSCLLQLLHHPDDLIDDISDCLLSGADFDAIYYLDYA